jgi:hypothetical protein
MDILVYKSKHDSDGINKKLDPTLPKLCFRIVMAAPSNSGKTNLILNMILNPKYYQINGKSIFEDIFIMSPTVLIDQSYETLQDNKDVWERVHLFDNLNHEVIEQLLTRKEKTPVLVVLDDLASTLKRSDKTLSNLFFRSRHNNISVIVTSQNYTSIPKPLRLNASSVFIFSFSSDKEIKSLESEMSSKHLYGKDFVDVLKEVVAKPYTFLYKSEDGSFHENWVKIKKSK